MNTTDAFDADKARQRALEATVMNILDVSVERAEARFKPIAEEHASVGRTFVDGIAGWLKRTSCTVASLWRGPGRAVPESLARSRDRMVHASRL